MTIVTISIFCFLAYHFNDFHVISSLFRRKGHNNDERENVQDVQRIHVRQPGEDPPRAAVQLHPGL